jgi:D-sedoheptulose 7-phosphate isomerase
MDQIVSQDPGDSSNLTADEHISAADWCRTELLKRNAIFSAFFEAEIPRLASASHEMSQRFLTGGRLLAFGRHAAASDAQHVSVEFVHPVIVGKRALPALDLGPEFDALLPVILKPADITMGFSFPAGNAAVQHALHTAQARGALAFALAGDSGDYPFSQPDPDLFISQEIFELLYHMLWETVHVYFEHREQGHDVGASSFLYPFLGNSVQDTDRVREDVQGSMHQKVAELNRMRLAVAEHEAETLVAMAEGIADRLTRGGKLLLFGNGGSATDAADLAIDCVAPPTGWTPVPAIALTVEPANITAIANDIGVDAIFTRQLMAHAQPEDVAIAFSTSGNSTNIAAALVEARRRGMLTVAFLGYDGGAIVRDRLIDLALVVRSDYIPRIQEVHASGYHVLRALIERLHVKGATSAARGAT